MTAWNRTIALATVAAACGTDIADRPGPAAYDVDPPTVSDARFVPAPGGLRLDVRADDPGASCGIAAVRAVVAGPGARHPVEPEMADDDGDGVWSGALSEDRCATAGEVGVVFLSVRDGAGNEREFRAVMGEEFLQATDRDVVLNVAPAFWGARAAEPRITSVTAGGPAGAGALEVRWQGDACGDVTWVARAADEDLRSGQDRDPACLPEGPAPVTEVLLLAPGGGGDARYDGLPTLHVAGSGLSERLPVEIDALTLVDLGDGRVRTEVAPADGSCEVLSRSGRLQRLPDAAGGEPADPVRRVAYFGDDGVATIPACAAPGGLWWLAGLRLTDRSGGVWDWRLRTDRPDLGYREDPTLLPPRIRPG